MWFLFSVWAVGPWSGWAQIAYLKKKHADKSTGFPIALTVIESIIHTLMCIIGILLIVATVLLRKKPSTDLQLNVEKAELDYRGRRV